MGCRARAGASAGARAGRRQRGLCRPCLDSSYPWQVKVEPKGPWLVQGRAPARLRCTVWPRLPRPLSLCLQSSARLANGLRLPRRSDSCRLRKGFALRVTGGTIPCRSPTAAPSLAQKQPGGQTCRKGPSGTREPAVMSPGSHAAQLCRPRGPRRRLRVRAGERGAALGVLSLSALPRPQALGTQLARG